MAPFILLSLPVRFNRSDVQLLLKSDILELKNGR